MTRQKRSYRDFRADDRDLDTSTTDHDVGLGATLAMLNDGTPRAFSESRQQQSQHPDESEEQWQVAESRSTKKRRKQQDRSGDATKNYPAIHHAAHARLQSHVKISDLQALVLYLLADGTAPQWVAVKHHDQVRKAVVLMVPGLEAGMLDGTIPLSVDVAAEGRKNGTSASGNGTESTAAPETSNSPIQQNYTDELNLSPDDYYPLELVSAQLPEPLKPLSDIFPHVWPVKTSGDERYGRINSPVTTMLTSPLPKSKDEKKGNGPQAPRAAKDWKDEPTPITSFLASSDELAENEYVRHPLNFDTTKERDEGLRKRADSKQTAAHGWMDSKVEPLTVGGPSNLGIAHSDLTAGKEVVAVDCEMCKTAGDVFELTRISLVSWDGKVLLDQLVKPDNPITDYLTP